MKKKFFLHIFLHIITCFLCNYIHAMQMKSNSDIEKLQKSKEENQSFSDDDSSSSASSDLTVYSSTSYEAIPMEDIHSKFSEKELRNINNLGLNEVKLPIKKIAEVITKLHYNIALYENILNYPIALKFLTTAKKKYKNMLINEKKRFKNHELFIIQHLLQQKNEIQVLEESTYKNIKNDIDKFSKRLNIQAIVRSSLSKITQKPYNKKIKCPCISTTISPIGIFTTVLTIGIIVMIIYHFIKLNILGDALNNVTSTLNGTLQSLNSTINNAFGSIGNTVNSITQSLQNTNQKLNTIQNNLDTLTNVTNVKLNNILSKCGLLP